MSEYIDCYYAQSRADALPRPALTGKIETEIAIVGAGLAGLTTALELARRGRKVAVLEAQRISWGASGRNGGFCGPGYAIGVQKIARQVGKEAARELYTLSRDGVAYVRDNLAAFGTPVDPSRMGLLSARRVPDMRPLEEYRDAMRPLGAELVVRNLEETRALLNSQRYFGSISEPFSFTMHPLNYALAMAAEIEKLGGRIFEDSAVEAVGRAGAAHLIGTAQGSVVTRHVVFCAGGYTDRLMPALRNAMLPIATYAMATEPNDELLDTAIKTPMGIGDERRAGDYYRRLADGRLLWGGRITAQTRDPADLAALLRRDMVDVYPQLAALKIESAWSGLMAYARHYMPQIGRLEPGIWYATSFGGHGLNTTAVGGRLIAAAIAEGDDRFKLFAPFGLVWNGGPVGPLAAQVVYWKLQAQDWWAERNLPKQPATAQ
jgi:gamma-glutamylputrescine oxidase